MKVVFYSPGTLMSETTQLEIEGNTIQKVMINSVLESNNVRERYGAMPYGFKIQGEKYMCYLPHNKIELYDDIKKRNDPKDSILLTNMMNNGWKAIVTTVISWKISNPFCDDDCILDNFGNIVIKGYEADINVLREKKLERILYENPC